MQRRHIHVAARIRPYSACDLEKKAGKVVNAISDSVIRISGGNDFVFDSAFGAEKSQVDVFNLVAKDIVKGCVEGYNGTIFAYGQTGSGKTYTMVGPGLLAETLQRYPEKGGLIPRVAELIFFLLQEKQKQTEAFMFEVKTTFVQLYKEKLYDLLRSRSGLRDLQIHLDDHGNTVLTGAEERVVNTISDLVLVVDEGLGRRKVAETAMNAESSRSHAILTFTIKTTVCNNGGITVNKCSRLNLVDLAGSERQKDAMSTGERLKEASSINLSLLMLGRVIRALSEPDFKQGSYIAYRDSTLTLLLKDSLGGNAQTAVIVTVHPNRRFLDETILTLRFAQQVKKVKNHVVVNEDLTGENVDAFKAEIHRLNVELAEVKRRCQQMEIEADEKCKVKIHHSNERLRIKFEKELNEKVEELKELKVRYARCIESFNLLRRYHEAPETVFDAIDEYMERGDKQIEFLKRNWSSMSANDVESCQLSQEFMDNGPQKENISLLGEQSMKDAENIAVEMSKASYNAIRRRLSAGTKNYAGNSSSQKSAAQIKRERRMTRFTMGTSSYNLQNSDHDMSKTVCENENGFKEPFDEPKEVDIIDWEKEKLKLEIEVSRLTQINEEIGDDLMKTSERRNELSVKNEQLEETIRNLLEAVKEEEDRRMRENRELDKVRQLFEKSQSENKIYWSQIVSLNAEKQDLIRKTDELKESIENLESDKALLKLTITVKEKKSVQLNGELQKLQEKWDSFHQEIFNSVIGIVTSETDSPEDCNLCCSSNVTEAINRIKEIVESKNKEVMAMRGKITILEKEVESVKKDCDDAANCVNELVHGNNSYKSRIQYIQKLREQLAHSKARVHQLEEELMKRSRDESLEGSRTKMVTRPRASQQKNMTASSDGL